MDQFLKVETIIMAMLLVVSLVAIVVRRLNFPYTVALVVVGLLISLQQPLQILLTPELILTLFVPPLVFEAAFHLNLTELRRNLVPVAVLAIPGVILTTFIVGGIASLGIGISLPLALVFGSLIAATDPISVVALFRALGVPKRLSVLMEGESLLNDGTAIVVFNIMLVVALAGHFDASSALTEFLRVAAGGLLVGLALGWLVSLLIARIDYYLIETALTVVLAFGSYLIAERLHVSGVLAVVAAGLINGNIGPRGMSPTARIVIFNFWEFVAFLANSFVFLLIGLDVNLSGLLADWRAVLWAVGAVLVARAAVVYGLSWLVNRTSTSSISMRWQHVLNWGGLRGAISLALVLSLPTALGAERDLLRVMTFGVVLFSRWSGGSLLSPAQRGKWNMRRAMPGSPPCAPRNGTSRTSTTRDWSRRTPMAA
jgi:CPA1 family monovalent cation:H+ antiporter